MCGQRTPRNDAGLPEMTVDDPDLDGVPNGPGSRQTENDKLDSLVLLTTTTI